MKRFLLFAYDTYYPGGGMGDCVADFDIKEQAIEEAQKIQFRDNWQVVDITKPFDDCEVWRR